MLSKGLFFHYFPTKREFVLAALAREQRELTGRLAPKPAVDPTKQFDAALEAFIDYVEERPGPYRAIFAGRAADPEINALLERGRAELMEILIDGLDRLQGLSEGLRRSPMLRTALQGWLYFVEGAALRWLEESGARRAQLKALLVASFNGTLRATEAAQRVDAGR